MSVPLGAYVVVSAALFFLGAAGVLVRRNAVVILMCVELMLNASNLALVAFSRRAGQLGAGNPLDRRWLKQWTGPLASIAIGASAVLAIGIFFEVRPSTIRTVVPLYNFMTVGDFHVDVAALIDPLSTVMLLVVTIVSFLIHVYAIGYMAHDDGFWRFFSWFPLFVFAMLILVMADNYLVMFVGWESVGLCSYLLIGFWFERPE